MHPQGMRGNQVLGHGRHTAQPSPVRSSHAHLFNVHIHWRGVSCLVGPLIGMVFEDVLAKGHPIDWINCRWALGRLVALIEHMSPKERTASDNQFSHISHAYFTWPRHDGMPTPREYREWGQKPNPVATLIVPLGNQRTKISWCSRRGLRVC
jgi:hypothetical protein